MENETITSIEIRELLGGVSAQALNRYKWMPPVVSRGKNGVKSYDRALFMIELKKRQTGLRPVKQPPKPPNYVSPMQTMINHFMEGRAMTYNDYKKVQNKGDIMLALRLKHEHPEKPWIYERRRDIVKCNWSIK